MSVHNCMTLTIIHELIIIVIWWIYPRPLHNCLSQFLICTRATLRWLCFHDINDLIKSCRTGDYCRRAHPEIEDGGKEAPWSTSTAQAELIGENEVAAWFWDAHIFKCSSDAMCTSLDVSVHNNIM